MAISTTGALLDGLAFMLNNIALVFMCGSVFGKSWQHGVGDKNDLPPRPGPTPNNNSLGDDAPQPIEYFISPFDECRKHSSHTNSCGLLYTTRFFIVIALVITVISYLFERLPMFKKSQGEAKSHLYTGIIWLTSALMFMIGLCCYTGWINNNSKFFKKDIDSHLNVLDWGYGQAYNFGWIGMILEVLSGFMFIYFGWAF